MMLFILAATYFTTIYFDFRQYLKDSAKGEKALYLTLLTISLVPMVLTVLEIPVPSHTKAIVGAVRAIFRVP